MDYFSSDWHLGHSAIIGLGKRPFANVDDMNQHIKHQVLSGKRRGDSIYFLGDMGTDKLFIEALLEKLRKSHVQFHWILGNHDNTLPLSRYKDMVTWMGQAKTIKRDHVKTYLHHFPCMTWDSSFLNSQHLYGHIHNGSAELERMGQKMEGKALNVNLEFHNYRLWTWDEIETYMKTRGDNWDMIRRFVDVDGD